MPSFHSDLSPSGSDIYLNCPGAPNAQRGLPDDAGFEAAQGTVFHEYAENCLKLGLRPEDFVVGTLHVENGYEVIFDQEMVDKMQSGLDYIDAILAEYPDAILLTEQWVRIPALGIDEQGRPRGGTSDVCIIIPSLRKIICFDWKYGGIPVYPTENNQARLYVLGCWEEFAQAILGDPEGVEVLIHIEQPRAPGGGGEWPTTMTDILKWAEDVALKVKATEDPHAPRIPGHKQCKYCRARKTCGAKAAWEFDMFGLQFSDADVYAETYADTGLLVPPVLPLPEDLTPERRAFVLLNRAGFISWLDALHEAALEDAKRGKPTPLQKVVDGRSGNREIVASKGVEFKKIIDRELAHEKAYTKPVLLPLTQLEEALGKKKFRELFVEEPTGEKDAKGKPIMRSLGFVRQDPPGPMLVPITDRRAARIAAPDLLTDDDI